MKALENKPEDRYPGMKEMLYDLRRLNRQLDREAEQARVISPGSDVATDDGATAQATATRPGLPGGEAITRTTSSAEYLLTEIKHHARAALLVSLLLLVSLSGLSYFYFVRSSGPISSLAILPFVNEGGNAEVEYLSDGMTDVLISSLSQLPTLNVKARSSVFRYKGKDVSPQSILYWMMCVVTRVSMIWCGASLWQKWIELKYMRSAYRYRMIRPNPPIPNAQRLRLRVAPSSLARRECVPQRPVGIAER